MYGIAPQSVRPELKKIQNQVVQRKPTIPDRKAFLTDQEITNLLDLATAELDKCRSIEITIQGPKIVARMMRFLRGDDVLEIRKDGAFRISRIARSPADYRQNAIRFYLEHEVSRLLQLRSE